MFNVTAINENDDRVPIEWTRGSWPQTSVEFVF